MLFRSFDEILGVKADWEGLKISPKVPADWNEYSMKRVFRNTEYNVSFIRVASPKMAGIWVDGDKIDGDLICVTAKSKVSVTVKYN